MTPEEMLKSGFIDEHECKYLRERRDIAAACEANRKRREEDDAKLTAYNQLSWSEKERFPRCMWIRSDFRERSAVTVAPV